MALRNYRDLDAWKRAMDLVETLYSLTKGFPEEEKYGLKAQIRRAAVSVPSNIAEGQARGTARFGLHFIRVAIGSIAELDTQLQLSQRLHFVHADTVREADVQIDRVRRLLYGMRREHEGRLAAGGAALVSLCGIAFLTMRLLS
ncbi:MAG: four helix bundle protein [Vicinamibacterales bacterium]